MSPIHRSLVAPANSNLHKLSSALLVLPAAHPIVTSQSVPVRTSLVHWILLITLLSNCLFFFNIIYYIANDSDSPEKALAPHSSTLAWKIPWTEEPGRLWSVGSLRVGHG